MNQRFCCGSRAVAGMVCLAVFCPSTLPASPDQPDLRDRPVLFNRDIRPILSENCFSCHGPDAGQRHAELRLDTAEGALADLGGYHAIVPGKPDESEAYLRIAEHDESMRMPPPDSNRSLSPDQVELVRRWIEQGAPWQGHWAFIPPQRPPAPQASGSDWPTNPVDAFVLPRLEAEGLQPSPEADKLTLIRRVTLDLTGLPPTLEEIDAFTADKSADAYEKLVDRLLASPPYGEQMTRYWLDLARYGDTHGLHLDNQRSIWLYRDWLVQAFNENKPFDEFTIEQLAGDLLPQPTLRQRIATGFNRCNVTTSEGGSIDEEYIVRYAVDRTSTMSTVWMGLTTECAVCHDHKFDPISQKEFYQLYAFFNSTADKAMDGNAQLPPPVVQVPSPEQKAKRKELEEQRAGVEVQIRKELAAIEYSDPGADEPCRELQPQEHVCVDESLAVWERLQRAAKAESLPDPVKKYVLADPANRTGEQTKRIREYFLEYVYKPARATFDPLHKQLDDLKKQQEELEKAIPATLVTQELPQPRDAHVLRRGEYDTPQEKVERGVPAVLPPLPGDAPKNRLGLAQWLVSPSHPLTARVTVNRFWQHYFGTGLVKTAEDFGAQGEWPSHPELLDWLAVEFMESGWDVKHMQRLIVTSATYRQSSRITPELYQRDPENRLLARGPRSRMDAEMVRDNALAISGLLVDRIGGPSVKPYQPPGLWEAVGYTTSDTAKFVQDHGDALYRRSMYTFWKRTSPPPAMLLLDAPSRETCTARRPRTNTPSAALALMNDVQFFEAARGLAERMMNEAGSQPEQRVALGFRLATARPPDPEEVSVLIQQYDAQLAECRKNPEAALKVINTGESKPDESLDPVELAAWTMVANVILNLDETITKR